MYNGVINVCKESGYTSFDVVAKLRGILKIKKIGHTGTLDPMATGVLPVCIGNATKLVDELTDRSKEYICTMLLGVTTDTEDVTGHITSRSGALTDKAATEDAIISFIGEYQQLPPMYSAIKIDGKRLYEYARNGVEVQRKTRQVIIEEIDILEHGIYDSDDEFAGLQYVNMRIACGKGTYIRSLCRDIGEKLGVGGCMASLCRSRVGNFRINEAFPLSEIERMRDDNRLDEIIIPVSKLLDCYEELHVRQEYKNKIDNGNPLPKEAFEENVDADNIYRIYNTEGQFCALYKVVDDILMPQKMFMS